MLVEVSLKVMMKKLCRIRLINWHYFINETINVKGSFLISGENTAGKSTVLDAIQLVLTTNARKFNIAANEKGNRNLKGYVRCKTGNEDSAYHRKGSVVSYVALEFYEEKTGKYFTLGVKIDSPDEDSLLTKRWFREECKLEELTFLTSGRPSTNEEFRRNDKKVQLIAQDSDAKARFGQRLGNLENKFFDMIPKSLAFKPMDNVKNFINNFILQKEDIEVDTLRSNIQALKELEDIMNITKEKIDSLDLIINKNNQIEQKYKEIKTNEILIKKAKLEDKKLELEKINKDNYILNENLSTETDKRKILTSEIDNDTDRLNSLKISLSQNEISQLILDIERNIKELKRDKDRYQQEFEKLDKMVNKVVEVLKYLYNNNIFIMSKEEVSKIKLVQIQDKSETIYKLKQEIEKVKNEYSTNLIRSTDLLKDYNDRKIDLEKEIANLKNKKLSYPINTLKLKNAIEKEFLNQQINSEVRILCDLLQITDMKWQDAVEGYLNTQRFYIIVEPKYYEIALEVYNKIRNNVHTVGLVNTSKLELHKNIDQASLAYIVKSENIYAKAYVTYILNKVTRCEEIKELKDFKVAITPNCMLYQNFAVRKIDQQIYKTPFIGEYAYQVQLKNKEEELLNLNNEIEELKTKNNHYKETVKQIDSININILEEYYNSPYELHNINQQLEEEKIELKKAKENPSIIELQLQIESLEKTIKEKSLNKEQSLIKIGNIEKEIASNENNIKFTKELLVTLENEFNSICEENLEIAKLGLLKFEEQIKNKTPENIVSNYSTYNTGLDNQKSSLEKEIMSLQSAYCKKYDNDLSIGSENIKEYIEEHHKLVSSEIIKYEENLRQAKYNCELEFKESFLAKLRENIENAITEFKYLNVALKDIYYGEDSYKFEITSNKKKESIYKMIMSKDNLGGFNLLSNSFEEMHKEEMEDLFAKLTAYDDKGDKVIAEYTDYRSYLDYDIEVRKKDGTVQKFSKIYGEKSGGETQTPYYVAIAASFIQLYKRGDTIRIIMFDEAFDKMDDNRISAMMEFLNNQNFQVIVATPPSKLEVIGESVDTILVAMREGAVSIIEEYDL